MRKIVPKMNNFKKFWLNFRTKNQFQMVRPSHAWYDIVFLRYIFLI